MSTKKNITTGLISLGTILEWAEYTFYGYMAFTLANLFFPENDPYVNLIKTYGIFAAGYLMRPVGALIFGHIGDRLGRKPALMWSLLLMGFATFGIGCLPIYHTIGFYAPLCLLALRIVQGIAVSGEYNGAAIFLVEKATQNPCLAGSWVSASAAFGMVLGGTAAFLVSQPSAPDWAWRIPFLLGGTSCFIGLWFRKAIPESALFLASHHPRFPLFEVFKHHKQSFIQVAAIAAFTGIFVYISNIYIVSFLKQYAKLPTHHATFFAIFGEIIVTLMIPLMAYIADKTDAYKQYRWGLLGIMLLSPLMFMCCATGHYGLITLAMVLYGIFNGIVCGPMMKILCDLFPVALRYSGISFAWGISAALFSGTAPLVAQYLTTEQKWTLGPGFYISLVAFLTYLLIRKKS